MIYTPLTKKAMKIAYEAHAGQTDQSGMPYIFHPVHLAEQMKDENTTCVALLHDVVEDTDVSLDDLKKEFPKEITDAIALMTHDKDVDYFDYVRKIKDDPIAKAVKLADLAHNSDETRLAGCDDVSEEQVEKWRAKYKKAKEILAGE
jgi:(p)ppGpp synthase/HD superfamily hydrolase